MEAMVLYTGFCSGGVINFEKYRLSKSKKDNPVAYSINKSQRRFCSRKAKITTLQSTEREGI